MHAWLPTVEIPDYAASGRSSAANAKVTLTLSALRKSLIMPVSLRRGTSGSIVPDRHPPDRRDAPLQRQQIVRGRVAACLLRPPGGSSTTMFPPRGHDGPRLPTAPGVNPRHHAPGATQARAPFVIKVAVLVTAYC